MDRGPITDDDRIAVIDSSASMSVMSTLTIRRLPDGVKERLRIRAAEHGRSMEAEARAILEEALPPGPAVDLTWVNAFIAIGEEFGGVELDIPEDEPASFATLDEMFADE